MDSKHNPDYTEVQLIIWEHMERLLDELEATQKDNDAVRTVRR